MAYRAKRKLIAAIEDVYTPEAPLLADKQGRQKVVSILGEAETTIPAGATPSEVKTIKQA